MEDLANGGSKIPRNLDQWKSNMSKQSHSGGPSYKRKKKGAVVEKLFRPVNECCKHKCFQIVDVSSQQYLFDEFWRRGKTKQIQDMNIASCLKKVAVKRRRGRKPNGTRRSNQWEYYIRLGSADVRICLLFLLQLYQVSRKRICVIQQKIIQGETSFCEKRGGHHNRPNRTPDNVLPLMKEHLSLIPSDELFYTPALGPKTTRINYAKLFDEFVRYYEDRTGTKASFSFQMYKHLYRKNSEYLNSAPEPATDEFSECTSVEVVILQMKEEPSHGHLLQPEELHDDPLSVSLIDELPDAKHHYPSLPYNGSSGIEDVEITSNSSILANDLPAKCDETRDDPVSTSSSDIPFDRDDTRDINITAVREFVVVDGCCIQHCYQKVEESSQRYLFDEFWNRGKSKQLQDQYLASCLRNADIKKKTTNSTRSQRQLWNYFVHLELIDVRVCRSFFANLYQISPKRVRIIQRKILRGDTSFLEERGHRTGQKEPIPSQVVPLMKKHTLSIPYYESDHRKFFTNPDIDLKKLFQAFRRYYQEQTGTVLSITLGTYSRLFQAYSEFSFSTDCIDECDFCSNLEITMFPAEDQLSEKQAHEDVCGVYTELKANLVEQAKSGNILLIEFDFLPNICVPRLNLVEELYKQLSYVFCFNVHCHCDDSSYMYLFSESKSAKDIDTVISCVFATIQPILESDHSYQKVVLLCNDCQDLSRHTSLLNFCSWMSVLHNVPFRQIFPIRGHSTNICSHNYALFRDKNRTRKRLIDVKPILIDMVSARMHPSSFVVAYNSPITENWTEALTEFFSAQPRNANRQKFLVQSYQQVEHESGNVYANTTFYNDSLCWLEFAYLIRNVDFRNIALVRSVPPGVDPAVRENVFSFFHFLTSKEIIKFQESFGV